MFISGRYKCMHSDHIRDISGPRFGVDGGGFSRICRGGGVELIPYTLNTQPSTPKPFEASALQIWVPFHLVEGQGPNRKPNIP